jgi:hypothetical protein
VSGGLTGATDQPYGLALANFWDDNAPRQHLAPSARSRPTRLAADTGTPRQAR